MSKFLDMAYTILREKGEPLTAAEIVLTATHSNALTSKGLTPIHTMKSKLSTDILKKRDKSLFMRSAKGKFALREWDSRLPEYTADRHQKALFDEQIVVFPKSYISSFIQGTGLTRKVPTLKEHRGILQSMSRRIAEEDPSVIQLVSVFVVRHKNRILTYKRTKRLPESRLHHFYSLAFGGHLNPDDISPLFNIFNPDQARVWLERELIEELHLKSGAIDKFIFRGLLYDDKRDVSRQHLGITYEVLVNTDTFAIGERGFLTDAKYESAGEIRSRRDSFENWSTMLLDELALEWS